MKCIVLLSLVALCYSYPYGSGYGSGLGYGLGSNYIFGKNFDVNPDGSITVTTGTGKIITISKGIGQNSVVTVAGPGLSGYFYGSQPTQGDILAQILAQYQGDVNQYTYQQLLGQIAAGVQSGQISNGIYQALQNLYQVGPYQGGYYGNQLVGTPYQANVLNVLAGQQQYQQGYPTYLTGVQQQIQYPYGQTVQDVVVPVTQQGQIYPQGLQMVSYPGMTGMSYWQMLINSYLNGKYPQLSGLQYNQQIGQPMVGQLSQMGQGQKAVLNQQYQIQQGQLQQQQQQQQMLGLQFQQQQQQNQLQNKQQLVQAVQEQQADEQEEVLTEQQQLLQKEQQQQQYNVMKNIMNGAIPFTKTTGQQTGFWQQQPSVYSQGGLYGVYGQGMQGYNMPMVL